VHLGADQQPGGVGEMWRLRPLTFLPASYPRGPPLSPVDYPTRRARFSASLFAGLLEQDEIDPFLQPIGLPRIEVALHRREVGKIVRQQAPRAGRSQDVKQALDNPPRGPPSRFTAGISGSTIALSASVMSLA
jgi:hypothetical protein